MRSEGFLFIVWELDLCSHRFFSARRGRVADSVVIGRWNLACLGACVCMDVSRGRRGGSWSRVRGVGSKAGVSRGRRGTPDVRGHLGGRWALDLLGGCGESCILILLGVRVAWGTVAIGGAARELSRDRRGDSWQAWGMVRPAAWPGIVLRGRRRESCTAGDTAGSRGPVREIANRVRVCVCVGGRVRRCEIVAGAGNLLICGC